MTWTWWMTLLVIFAVLALIGCIPAGVDARYNKDGVFLAAKIWFVKLQLLPAKPKKPKKAAKKQPKAQKQTEAKKTAPAEKKQSALLSGGVEGLLELLDLAFDTLGNLRRKLRVNELTLRVTIPGGDDPAKAAMNYGRAWAAVGALTPAMERLFVIKKRDIQPFLDYNETDMQLDAHLTITITIGRSLALALRAGIRFLKIMNQRKKGGAST